MRTPVRMMAGETRQPVVAVTTTKKRKIPAWVQTLRTGLNGQNGEGWTVREIRGRIQLSVRFNNGQRSTVVLELPWAGTSQAPLLTTAAAIKGLMAQGHDLQEACKLLSTSESVKDSGTTSWAAVAERFEARKLGSGEVKERTWKRMYAPVVAQVLAAMAAKPRPTTGKRLLQALVEAHGGAPGSRGRQVRLQHAAQLLKFAVTECGAEGRWLPPEDLTALVGKKAAGKAPTVPIKDHQIARLLEAIPNPKWRTAVGLVACFGLRGVELGYIQPRGPLLHCSYEKRTARGSTKPRDIVGLDPVGLEGLSADLLALLAEQGAEALPSGCRGKGGAGDALHQYLERLPIWAELVAETRELNDQALVPYSLRHGYALRAHEVYGHSPRVAAALMGHSLQTHSSVYGAWTDAEVIASALARTMAATAARQKQEA